MIMQGRDPVLLRLRHTPAPRRVFRPGEFSAERVCLSPAEERAGGRAELAGWRTGSRP